MSRYCSVEDYIYAWALSGVCMLIRFRKAVSERTYFFVNSRTVVSYQLQPRTHFYISVLSERFLVHRNDFLLDPVYESRPYGASFFGWFISSPILLLCIDTSEILIDSGLTKWMFPNLPFVHSVWPFLSLYVSVVPYGCRSSLFSTPDFHGLLSWLIDAPFEATAWFHQLSQMDGLPASCMFILLSFVSHLNWSWTTLPPIWTEFNRPFHPFLAVRSTKPGDLNDCERNTVDQFFVSWPFKCLKPNAVLLLFCSFFTTFLTLSIKPFFSSWKTEALDHIRRRIPPNMRSIGRVLWVQKWH